MPLAEARRPGSQGKEEGEGGGTLRDRTDKRRIPSNVLRVPPRAQQRTMKYEQSATGSFCRWRLPAMQSRPHRPSKTSVTSLVSCRSVTGPERWKRLEC